MFKKMFQIYFYFFYFLTKVFHYTVIKNVSYMMESLFYKSLTERVIINEHDRKI